MKKAEDMSKTRLELREHAERQQRETLLARQTLIREREAVAPAAEALWAIARRTAGCPTS